MEMLLNAPDSPILCPTNAPLLPTPRIIIPIVYCSHNISSMTHQGELNYSVIPVSRKVNKQYIIFNMSP